MKNFYTLDDQSVENIVSGFFCCQACQNQSFEIVLAPTKKTGRIRPRVVCQQCSAHHFAYRPKDSILLSLINEHTSENGTEAHIENNPTPESISKESTNNEHKDIFIKRPLASNPYVKSIGLPLSACITTQLPNLDHASPLLKLVFSTISQITSNKCDENIKFVIEVLQRLFLRGNPTRLSPWLEKSLLDNLFPKSGFHLYEQGEYCIKIADNTSLTCCEVEDSIQIPPRYFRDISSLFGSESEKKFYYDVLPQILGPLFSDFTYLQVPIRSLIPESDSPEFIDFLISCPGSRKLVAIEFDGPHHEKEPQRTIDMRRDASLKEIGIETIRISLVRCPSLEIQIEELKIKFSAFAETEIFENNLLHLLATDCLAFQYLLVSAIGEGILSLQKEKYQISVVTQLPPTVVDEALQETLSAFLNLAKIYGASEIQLPTISLNVSRNVEEIAAIDSDIFFFVSSRTPSYKLDSSLLFRELNTPILAITAEYHPYSFIWPQRNVSKYYSDYNIDTREEVLFFLRWIFWKVNFRPFQYEGIKRAISGLDSIVLLPTGSGKSIVYQLSSLLNIGPCICIAPLVSLVKDQERVLRKSNYITRVFGFVGGYGQTPASRSRGLELLAGGELLFAFLTPERFQQVKFQESFKAAFDSSSINVIVIDEAHVVSEWGHDFRPAYLRIGQILKSLLGENRPPFLALTATAARNVLRDIQRQLAISDSKAIITPASFDRSNLSFRIRKALPRNADSFLHSTLEDIPKFFNLTPADFWDQNSHDPKCGLIFILTVGGYRTIDQVHMSLNTSLNKIVSRGYVKTERYCGAKPKSFSGSIEDWDGFKTKNANDFIENRIQILVATSAFGMGIDKPNVRFTINFGLPSSIESFYQQAGRAGRDGANSICYLIFECDDNLVRELSDEKWYLNNTSSKSDLGTQAFFLKNNFPGVDAELIELSPLLDYIDNNKGNRISVVQRKRSRFQDKAIPARVYSFGDSLVIESDRVLYCIACLEKLSSANNIAIHYAANLDLHISVDIPNSFDTEIISSFVYDNEHIYDPFYANILAERMRSLPAQSSIHDIYRVWLEAKYETVLRGRIRSLRELAYMARDEVADSELRNRIESYLSDSIFSAKLDKLITDGESNIDAYLNLGNNASLREWTELGLQAGRLLEASPNNPGLLTLRAISIAIEGNQSFSNATHEFTLAESAFSKITNLPMGKIKFKIRGESMVKVNDIVSIFFILDKRTGFTYEEQDILIQSMRPIKGAKAEELAQEIIITSELYETTSYYNKLTTIIQRESII